MRTRQVSLATYTGGFCMLVVFVNLLTSSITAPTLPVLAILKVGITTGSRADSSPVFHFGAFGYCITQDQDGEEEPPFCTPRTIGYDPAQVIREHAPRGAIPALESPTRGTKRAARLTRAMVLHPVGCGLALTTSLLALLLNPFCTRHIRRRPLAPYVLLFPALLTLATVFVIVVVDFVGWSGIRDAVGGSGTSSSSSSSSSSTYNDDYNNNNNNNNSWACWGTGGWTVVSALVASVNGVAFLVWGGQSQSKKSRGAAAGGGGGCRAGEPVGKTGAVLGREV